MLTSIILTHNSQDNILTCLKSILFSDEIILIDDLSTDKTIDIAKGFCNKNKINLQVFHKKLDNFSSQRNFGVKKASNNFILFIDSDEYLSKDLQKEIQQITRHSDPSADREESGLKSPQVFQIPRKDIFLGKTLNHGEVGDTNIIRLMTKKSGSWQGFVHETFVPNKNIKIKTLENSIIHNHNISISDFFTKINHYSTIRAKELKKQNKKEPFLRLFFYPFFKFIYNYFFKLGFLDGFPGFALACLMSYHSFLVRIKLQLLNRNL